MPVALGIYGLLLGSVSVIALMGGRLSLDAHGFGLVRLQSGGLVHRGRNSVVAIQRATPVHTETCTA